MMSVYSKAAIRFENCSLLMWST